jgi:hypothetical protein
MNRSSIPWSVAALVALSLMVLAGPSVGQARAQTTPQPTTLDGEILADPSPSVSATCNPDGTSTITFEASGLAVGPFAGTFEETGEATVGPQSAPPDPPGGDIAGTLTSFTATFTIDSPAGQVTGSKELLAEVELGGTCQDEPRSIRVIDAPEGVRYTAEIQTPTGETFVDRGSSIVTVADVEATGEDPGGSTFAEHFMSQPLPTSKDECKKGGFEDFDFENQGECVSSVATGGSG